MLREYIKILLLLVLCTGYLSAFEVVITLSDGKVKGRSEVTKSNVTFYSFTGIPYAQPPVGSLRFQAPQPVEPWSDVFDATSEGSSCRQVGFSTGTTSEDCLIINVYTPRDPSTSSPLPVMFFIYGGGFVVGSSERSNYGPEHFMAYDVIVVTFNYRVGPYGFFSTGDSEIPGNAGLKDQNLALQWVQKNIRNFGGDPDKVTIFGESAGSASVAYQILSPKSKGLFRGAICESGSALSPWAYQRNQVDITRQTATKINSSLSSATSSELLQFLVTVDATDLDSAAGSIPETTANLQIKEGFFFAPVIEHDHEDAFIKEDMYESFSAGEFNEVALIIGYNSEESLGWFGDRIESIAEDIDKNLALLVPVDMHVENEDAIKAGQNIKELYSPNDDFANNTNVLYKYFSDQSFIRSIIKHAELQSLLTDVYFYQFSYGGVLGGNTAEPVEGFSDSVRHGEELAYLFARYNFNKGVYTSDLSGFPESDILTHKRLITMFTNFAKSLNPTPKESDLLANTIWPKFSSDNASYLDIGSDLVVKEHPRSSTYDGWSDVYEAYGIPPYDTY